MTPQEAWQTLRDDPEYFLRWYPLKMAGSNLPMVAGAANPKVYSIYKLHPDRDGTAPGDTKRGHHGATRPSRNKVMNFFNISKNISSFHMSTGGLPQIGAHGPINACYVPMLNWNSDSYGMQNLNADPTALPYYVADNSGDGFMATGQLSGCCFAWQEVGGNLYCSHVNPAGGDGGTMQDAMAATGQQNGAPGPLQFYGRRQYAALASVVGLRNNAGWRLYAQTSADSFHTVNGLRRLHPNPVVLR